MNYFELVSKLLPGARLRWGHQELIEGYENLVWHCETGYPTGLDGYWNQMAYRDWLQTLMDAPELHAFVEYSTLLESVAELDARLKQILIEDSPLQDPQARWWHMSLPRFGGSEFVREAAEQYGLTLQEFD